jgi:hypothetical protein
MRVLAIAPNAVAFLLNVCGWVWLAPAALAQDRSLLASPAAVEEPIGKVVSTKGIVTIEHTAAVIVQANLQDPGVQAKVGDLVYRGDVLQTGADGRLGLTLADGTTFNLSSNGRMVLNQFVYDPSAKSNAALFSLTKGSFTFVAGAVAKIGDMKVDTPVATLGIRGTTPRVEILDNGSVRLSTLVEEEKKGTVPIPRHDSGRPKAIRARAFEADKPQR